MTDIIANPPPSNMGNMVFPHRQKRFVLAAGGTGGHFFPALALGKELQKRGHAVCMITDIRARHYNKKLEGMTFIELKSSTVFAGSFFARLLAPIKITLGVLRLSFFYLWKRPHAVIGFGGYPSFAPVMAARLLAIPIGVHEQNAVLGRANRVLVFLGAKLAISYVGTKLIPHRKRGKSIVTGNPLREEILQVVNQPYSASKQNESFSLLVFGGSQGASVFTDILPQALAALPIEKRKRLRLVQQCRKSELKSALKTYGAMNLDVELRDFFDDMPQRIAASHLIIARSGASTVCELAAIGRPSILIPLPGALDNDQMMNAVHLSNYKAAILVKQRSFTADKVSGLLGALMDAPGRLSTMAGIAKSRGELNAVGNLADFSERQAGLSPLPNNPTPKNEESVT